MVVIFKPKAPLPTQQGGGYVDDLEKMLEQFHIEKDLPERLAKDLAKAWPTDRPEEPKPAPDPDRFWKATQDISKGR